MTEQVFLQATAEKATEAAGSSLARSLYRFPVTIGISGPLGVGKTAFLRGFLREWGVPGAITSPTYALEQRYTSPRGELIHIDLYRLNEAEARHALLASDDHPSVRCIEWPERAGDGLTVDIAVRIEEQDSATRTVDISCQETTAPDDAVIDAWRSDLHLPENVAAHCDAVAAFCDRLARLLIARGTFVRPRLLHAAARTHDLLRFMDFRPSASPTGWAPTDEQQRIWGAFKQRYGAVTHEEAAERFLTEQGFPAVASIVGAHLVTKPIAARTTTEAHLLYYADKRFIGDRCVTVAERYDDFGQRYGGGVRSPESLQWERDAHETERLLFPEGLPL